MPNYVCNGAKMMCTFGASPGSLSVLPANRIQMEGNPAACIMDFAPMVNVGDFGLCSSLVNPVVAAATAKNLGVLEPQKCIPVIVSPWMPGKPDALMANQPALMDFCLNTCAYFGIVTISDAGQTSISSEMAAPDMGAFIAEFEAGMDDAIAAAEEEAEKELQKEKEEAAKK